VITALSIGAAFVVAVLVTQAGNRESRRVVPAQVFTPAFDLPEVGDYDLAASRIRPGILRDIEETR
jgi:hypothetical protein